MTKVDETNNKVNAVKISADEAKLYDRQIRLWGVEAQRKLRTANVLMIGLSGVASEIIKNIVLSGINSLTIVDDLVVNEYDSLSNLFTQNQFNVNRGQAAIENIRLLNPLVNCNALDLNVIKLINDEEQQLTDLITGNDIICITNYDSEIVIKLNNLVRKLKENDCKFYSINCWGYFSFSCNDLGKCYKYIVEESVKKDVNVESKSVKQEEEEKSFIEKSLSFPRLESVFTVKSGKSGLGLTKNSDPVLIIAFTLFKFHSLYNRFPNLETRDDDINKLKDLQEIVIAEHDFNDKVVSKLNCSCNNWHQLIFQEISPVTSIVGGVIAQDIIRAITVQDTPIKNLFLFNGFTFSGFIETLGS